jgi:3-methyladenine DNA glycosylase AlkC
MRVTIFDQADMAATVGRVLIKHAVRQVRSSGRVTSPTSLAKSLRPLWLTS